jgi:hypothetical protein
LWLLISCSIVPEEPVAARVRDCWRLRDRACANVANANKISLTHIIDPI